jgi:hypothetical protein
VSCVLRPASRTLSTLASFNATPQRQPAPPALMMRAPMTSAPTPTPAPVGAAPTSTSTTATPTAATATTSRRVPLDKRKRTETSCDKCKSRKQKCRKEPGHDACRYCLVHNIECLTTQPRKKRLYGSVEGLGNRLALLEALVKGLLPEANVSNADELRSLGTSLGIPMPDAHAGEATGEQHSGSDPGPDEPVSLLPDQQGQAQWIGDGSSLAFHFRLRALVGGGVVREFTLFGRNAAEQEPIDASADPHDLSTPSAASNADHNSPAERRGASASDVPSLESLIGAYFDHINPDFPILHEPSFREAYEAWLLDPSAADPAWLCSFLCVLLLSRRVARITFPDDQERLWWRRVQTLLPVVTFTSSIMAVQALLLASLHLHNTNHRDACWNLTGTAVRIAFAIGLHQDSVNTMQTPLARELRKRLWWTLYAYEQMQVSSYDRPSAIEHLASRVGYPNERIIGMTSYCPPDYYKWSNRLVVHLGSACRAPKTIRPHASEESYVGPLSPAASVLRDLERWKDSIPQSLRLDALDASPPAFQRPLLLLHAMYHYTVIVLCRAALLARATVLLKEGTDSKNTALLNMAESCATSGRTLAQILLNLEAVGKFDAITWWDVWYGLAASSSLLLDLVCLNKMPNTNMSGSRMLLSQLAELAQRHKRNPHMPGTIEKFASILPELHSMSLTVNTQASLEETTSKPPAPSAPAPPENRVQANHQRPPHQPPPEMPPFTTYHQSTTNSGAYMFADHLPARFYPDQEYTTHAFPNARFDRNTQMSFMDFTVNNVHDWNWGDLGSLLGNDGVPHSHPQPPMGSLPPS